MTQTQVQDNAAAMAASPFQQGDNVIAAVQQSQQVVDTNRSQDVSASQPIFSFDDGPLFGADTDSADATTAAPLPDDFFSSPEWTDPSPALTTSMSFTLDSCDTSPLLTDNYDAPDLSGVSLFGDYRSMAPFETISHSNAITAKRLPQNAFNGIKDVNEESAMLLLRAFSTQGTASLQKDGQKEEQDEMPLTASPCAISTPLPSSNFDTARPSLSTSSSMQSLFTNNEEKVIAQRGHKRRMDASELLPMDAPIQPRTYKTPSATSRRESKKFAEEEAAIAAEKDPLVAKRLSNTLAARRSRHRRAEELKTLHETIDEQENEIAMWKRRCLQAEAERDQALNRCASL